jgi:hypothetical protein
MQAIKALFAILAELQDASMRDYAATGDAVLRFAKEYALACAKAYAFRIVTFREMAEHLEGESWLDVGEVAAALELAGSAGAS